MSLISMIKREFFYLTNNIKWRKFILFVPIIISTSYLLDGDFFIQRFWIFFEIVILIFIITNDVLRFKSKVYADIPNDDTHQTIAMLIYKLWNRVQFCAFVTIAALSIHVFMEISLAGFIAETFFLFTVYYNLTMVDSHMIFTETIEEN